MSILKAIPKVDKVLQMPSVRPLLLSHSRPVVLKAVRASLDELRSEVMKGSAGAESLTEEAVGARVSAKLSDISASSLKRVVNGTGVVIHTNLGRSLLPSCAVRALKDAGFHYSNLEFDLEKGERGSRYSHVERLLCELSGAEAALVVNNNAAAVLLALASLAPGREVVVSRGELVEIGGSFRIPEVMGQSGAILKETGTTNRTHPGDYRSAVTPETALLLKVHASNFALVGFTAEVKPAELAAIGRESGVPVMVDMGSGNFTDVSQLPGCGPEPTVRELIGAGVDVVTFSGDKLLGGPQAGVIVGRKSLLAPMKKHPLLRALRIDKLTLAALEETLRLYRDERQAMTEIPTLRMLFSPAAYLETRGKLWLRRLRRRLPPSVALTLVEGSSQAGGGALPLLELPTVLIAVSVAGMSAREVEAAFRRLPTPVIGRIQKDRFLLDLRTILDDDFQFLETALRSISSFPL